MDIHGNNRDEVRSHSSTGARQATNTKQIMKSVKGKNKSGNPRMHSHKCE